MALELPAISAVIARMENPEISLAAYGGIVFPLALIIEAPIIMLLAASTALSKDYRSFLKIRKFMHLLSGTLTLIHLLIVSTPLYTLLAERIIGAPAEIIGPGRIGLAIMLPWTWSVAYRRFHQGVLIRYQKTGIVSVGTFVRLGVDLLILLAGYYSNALPGIVIATIAISSGVAAEAIFIGLLSKPVIQNKLVFEPEIQPELTRKAFLIFYIPLALTSLITLLSQPLISSALSRMPDPLSSLALWPVLSGLLFMLRSPGVAYNEVVVSLIEKHKSFPKLQRFAGGLVISTTFLTGLIALSPVSDFWLISVSALPGYLIEPGKTALMLGLLVPGANSLQSWFQGLIVYSNRTRGIPEAVIVFLLVTISIYAAGILLESSPGISIGILGFSAGMITQAGWLFIRSREAVRELKHN